MYVELEFSLVKCFISKQMFWLLDGSLRECNAEITVNQTHYERNASVIIEAMSIIHYLLLRWDCIPADLWNSNGLTSVGGCS